jgi:cell wall-associated NlpC family hydrolase
VNTLGWLFILSGILIARQVSRGRIMEISTDLGDAFIAVASGDSDALGEVLGRKGEAATPTAADEAIANLTEGVTGAFSITANSLADGIGEAANQISGIAVAAIILGSKAKGYRWASTGPDYYDCSGLMWRACQGVGYKGSRFSTASIGGRKEFKKVASPSVNDIVLWTAGRGGVTGHMGVVTGPNRFYSARSLKSGIGESGISSFRKVPPVYLRYVGPKG